MLALEGVRELRESRMLSQEELAEKAGVSAFTIQRVERGVGGVRPKTGRAIAAALGVEVSALLPKATRPLPFGDWPVAVGNARHVREYASYSIDRSLAAWRESTERGDTRAAREHLDGIGRLLQAAHDAERGLWSAGADEVAGAPETDEYIAELQEASRFYQELRRRVQAAGLRVVRGDQVEDLAA